RRRGRHQHEPLARARADGAARAHHLQVPGAGERPDPRVSGIGIFGGTFDPIHLGHLRAAEEVREAEELDEMWLVPAALPPHKEGERLAAAAERLRMVELAVAGAPVFRVSRLALDPPGASYSVDTLRTLRAEVSAATRLVFVLGRDAFRDFHLWKEH